MMKRQILFLIGVLITALYLFPLYWMPLLGMMSTEQMMAQRVVWTALFCVFLVISLKQYAPILAVLKKPRTLLIIMLTGSILSVNWLIYLYAISIHEVLQSSLGYFMSPLITLLLGRIFFNEKLTQVKTIAVSLVGLGVLWLIFLYGDIPWLSLGISATFGVYALLRKLAPLAALPGLTVETLTMLPFALVYLGGTLLLRPALCTPLRVFAGKVWGRIRK